MRTDHFCHIMATTEAFFAVEKAHPDCRHARRLHHHAGELRESIRPLMDDEQNAALDAKIIALGGGTNKD